ncbi:unnamed protein product [Camellia sinensis]
MCCICVFVAQIKSMEKKDPSGIVRGPSPVTVASRDTDDGVNSVVAGRGTGALYKAASGPRSTAVAAASGGVVVGK